MDPCCWLGVSSLNNLLVPVYLLIKKTNETVYGHRGCYFLYRNALRCFRY